MSTTMDIIEESENPGEFLPHIVKAISLSRQNANEICFFDYSYDLDNQSPTTRVLGNQVFDSNGTEINRHSEAENQ